MKAAVLTRYGKNERLIVKDISMPSIAENEVLVQVKVAAVNPLDNMITNGEVKLIVPYKTPLVLGNELSGVVEKVGNNVTRFKKGDRVYGRLPLDKIGAFAEYAAIDQNALALIPEELSFQEAETVPLTALTAVQALELAGAEKGETIFISGGTGSLGAMAIPIAKNMGLYVITNGSVENRNRVKKLGADQFIDYKTEDYAKILSDVDIVLDTLGEKELEKEFSILKTGGRLISLRGLPNGRFSKRAHMSLLKRMLFTVAGRKYDRMADKKHGTYDFIFVHEDGEQLDVVGQMLIKNGIETSIDTIFSLEEVNEALEKVRNGRSRGKTILLIDEEV